MFMTLFYDYRVQADGIYLMLLHALPIRLCRMDSILETEVTTAWTTWYPPFRTLRLGNRLRRGFVVVRKRGIFKFLLLTPDDPAAFLADIEARRASHPAQLFSGPSAGFTLLETLVALSIVAIGFASAFGAIPEGLGAQDKARNLEAATGVAESALAQGIPGDGVAGRFAWHEETLPVPGAAQAGAFGGQVQRVTVRWAEGQNARSLTLQTLRLGLLPRG